MGATGLGVLPQTQKLLGPVERAQGKYVGKVLWLIKQCMDLQVMINHIITRENSVYI